MQDFFILNQLSNAVKNLFSVILFFISFQLQAQFTVTANNNAMQLAQKIVGPGIRIVSASFTGSTTSAGFFVDNSGTLGINSGVLLTSGKATNVMAPASSQNDATFGPGDPDLDFLASGGTGHDACFLQFTFIPIGDSIVVNYVFASEEYPEYACSNFNDVFGFLLKSPLPVFPPNVFKNIALVPGTTIPVKINTVNPGAGANGSLPNCTSQGTGSPFTQYYRNNSTNQYIIYDGMTTVLTARAKVVPCQPNTIKIGVEDITDGIFDSGVFIEANSFRSDSIALTKTGGFTDYQGNNNVAIEGCKNVKVKIELEKPAGPSGKTLAITYKGSATRGIDYTASKAPTSITFVQGQKDYEIEIEPLVDNDIEPLDSVIIEVGPSCSDLVYKTTVFIKDSIAFRYSTDTVVCSVTPITLTAHTESSAPANNYIWNIPPPNNNTQSITVNHSGTYIAVNNYLTNCYNVDTFKVAKGDPDLFIGNDTSFCTGDSVLLNVIKSPAGGNLLWNDNSTDTFKIVNNSGQFWVKYTMANGCFAKDTVTVTKVDYPEPKLGADTAFCANTSVTINATTYTGATYLWNTGATTNSITVNNAGTYSIISTMGSCVAKDTIVVTKSDLPIPNLGADTTLCGAAPLTLNATYPGATTYLWSTGATTSTINVNSSGTYSVTNTLNGCVSKDTIVVTMKTVPFPNVGSDTAICSNASVTINATTYPGATYLWNTGSTTNSITVNTPGSYIITNTLNGCVAKDTIVVTKSDLPTPNLGADTVLCGAAPLILNATYPGATTYLWSTGATTSTINVSNSGTYSVTNTLNGCIAKDTIVVTIKPVPYPNVGADTAICSYESVLLKSLVYPGATYLWSTGATTNSINVNSPGTYFITNTLNGCVGKDTVIVKAKKAAIAYAGNDLLMYVGSSVTLTASQSPDNKTYQWSPPTYLTTPNSFTTKASPPDSTDVHYYLKVTSVDGCVAYDTMLIKINNASMDIPNAFSPNGDGINDKWEVPFLSSFPTSRVQVFNRNGQVVYSGNGFNYVPWDGTYNGKPAPAGVYYYVIDIGSGFPRKQGWVAIIR